MSRCYIDTDKTKWWYQFGQLHREDGPAVEWVDGSTHWCINGQYHREDGPAVEFKGTKIWYRNGKKNIEKMVQLLNVQMEKMNTG